MWSEQFRFKHLATGYFLTPSEVDVTLTSDASSESTLFTLLPDSEVMEEEIPFGTILTMQCVANRRYVGVETSSGHLYMVSSKKNYSEIAFVVEDVQESATAHIYKLSLTLPIIEDFWKFIDRLGISQSQTLFGIQTT
jgi:hypothetical protein